MAFDYGYSATLCLGIFPVRFSIEPASLRIAYANTNALGFHRFPSRIDYDVVCASQMHPLSRNSDFAFLGNRKTYRLLVRCNCTLLSVRLDVLANKKAGTLTDENTITCSAGRKRKKNCTFYLWGDAPTGCSFRLPRVSTKPSAWCGIGKNWRAYRFVFRHQSFRRSA